jgi:3-hydroxy-9,10-secoandrosta-1,3,5(10)-triene-9,17-dione monooxygenase
LSRRSRRPSGCVAGPKRRCRNFTTPASWGDPADGIGGFEADFICQIDLSYEIARSCGASGWVYAVLSAHAAMIANFSERAQQEVWGYDPCALASSSLSWIGRFKRVDGGYLVSGFWRYSSGCDYCAWLVAGADAKEPAATGRRSRRRFLLPIPALEIVDNWQVLVLPAPAANRCVAKT